MSQLHAAEFVLPGHPDKLCDAIADALVQEASRREKRALCGVEVAVHRATVFVTGRIACTDAASINVPAVVRGVYASAGYAAGWGPAPERLRIEMDLCRCPLNDGEAEFRAVADDQSIVIGHAVDLPGTNYLPPEHWLAWRLAQRLAEMRTALPHLRLGPDGKVAVLLEEDGPMYRLAAFSASLQQVVGGPEVELGRAVRAVLRGELQDCAGCLPGLDPALPEAIAVNGAGNFEVGGPEGDNGLSGKKLVVDAYGPGVPIGGGALCGKDFYKVDRAGAIIARRLAKAVVLAGAARACISTLAFFPGQEAARVVGLRDEAGRALDASRWVTLMDLSLAGAGDRWTGRADLVDVARRGHFTLPERPWEVLHFDG
jgi:S-adenosylmethionine synthetase